MTLITSFRQLVLNCILYSLTENLLFLCLRAILCSSNGNIRGSVILEVSSYRNRSIESKDGRGILKHFEFRHFFSRL